MSADIVDNSANRRYVETMNDTFVEQLKQYEDKWVALLGQTKEIVGSGEDASEAKKKAEQRGYKDVTLFRVLPFRSGYVPLA